MEFTKLAAKIDQAAQGIKEDQLKEHFLIRKKIPELKQDMENLQKEHTGHVAHRIAEIQREIAKQTKHTAQSILDDIEQTRVYLEQMKNLHAESEALINQMMTHQITIPQFQEAHEKIEERGDEILFQQQQAREAYRARPKPVSFADILAALQQQQANIELWYADPIAKIKTARRTLIISKVLYYLLKFGLFFLVIILEIFRDDIAETHWKDKIVRGIITSFVSLISIDILVDLLKDWFFKRIMENFIDQFKAAFNAIRQHYEKVV